MPQLVKVGLLGSTGLASGAVRVPSPSFTLDAATGALPFGTTFTRASGATRVDHRGYLAEVAEGTPRFTYDPALVYNQVVDPWGSTGVAGTTTMPTNVQHFFSSMSGGTREFVGYGVDGGIPYFDVRSYGVINFASTTGTWTLRFPAPGATDGTSFSGPGTFTGKIGARVLSASGVSSVDAYSQLIGMTVAGAGGAFGSTVTPPADGTRAAVPTLTHTQVGTSLSLTLRYFVSSTGSRSIDVVLRVYFPVLNAGSEPLEDAVGLSTLAARVGTTPQYGLLGLLLEEASTNRISNPRAEGTVVGSPGTSPPPWVCSVAPGSLTRTVVGTGVEAGIPYVDFRWSGTPSGNWTLNVDPQGRVDIPAVAGETWTASQFVRLVGGTAANLSNPKIGISERRTADGGAAALLNDFLAVPNLLTATGSLAQCRYTHTRTLTNASTDRVTSSAFRVDVTSGMPIDFTVRVGAPQIENNPYPTSVVLAPSGAPAVTTRARDDLLFAPDVLDDFSSATIAVRLATSRGGNPSAGNPGTTAALHFGNTGTSERVFLRFPPSTNSPRFDISAGGATVASFVGPTGAGDAFFTGAISWGGGSASCSYDGGTAVEDASAASPNPLIPSTLALNRTTGPSSGANCIFRFLRVWNGRKLTAAQVAAASKRTS